MDPLFIPCPGCRRHVFETEQRCPFCGLQRLCEPHAAPPLASGLRAASVALSVALLLSGCKTGETTPENSATGQPSAGAGQSGQAGSPRVDAAGSGGTAGSGGASGSTSGGAGGIAGAAATASTTGRNVSPPAPTVTATTAPTPTHRQAPKYGMPPINRPAPKYGMPPGEF